MVRPFLTIAPALVRSDVWRTDDGLEMATAVPTWDHGTALRASRLFEVDPMEVRAACRLPAQAPLHVVVEWTSASGLSGLCDSKPIPDGRTPVALKAHIGPGLLTGSVSLVTRIVLAASLAHDEAFVAKELGSVLFEDVFDVVLGASGAQFPISSVDFSAASFGFDEHARWRLETPLDLKVPTMGGLRLYVNAADEQLVEALVDPTTDRPDLAQVFEALQYDVARTLFETALLRYDELEGADFPIGSFGRTLQLLLEIYEFGDSPATLRELMATQPGLIASSVQAVVRRGSRR